MMLRIKLLIISCILLVQTVNLIYGFENNDQEFWNNLNNPDSNLDDDDDFQQKHLNQIHYTPHRHHKHHQKGFHKHHFKRGNHFEKYRPKFFGCSFRHTINQPTKTYLFNVDRYGNWSEWSNCSPSECIEVRYRKCLDNSWKTVSMNKIHTTKCLSAYYAEKRTCLDKSQCHTETGSQIIQNLTKVCGYRPGDSDIVPKILGGKTAEPNSWPWAVRLSVKIPRQKHITFCGGTLITPQWVLTAAHCVLIENKRIPVGKPIILADHMKSTIYAHLGDHDRIEDEKSQKDHRVDVAILHPKYHRKLQTDGYDIALLRLAEPAQVTPEVDFACLPSNDILLKPGTKCYAVGWGSEKGASVPTFDNLDFILESLLTPWPRPFSFPFKRLNEKSTHEQSSKELKEVELPIISIEQCRRHYTDISSDVHICAGTKGKDTCSGDSGGGLYCKLPQTKQWTVVGVTSFGLARGCGLNPGVYTSTSTHLPWITKQLGAKLSDIE